MKRIGVLFGMENTFPPAVVARINEISGTPLRCVPSSRKIGTTDMEVPSGYDLIIDRISHDIPYYRAYLKNAMLHGAKVINNPFWWSADDKFFNYDPCGAVVSRCRKRSSSLLVQPPDTTSMSMRNLIYPLDWNEVFRNVLIPQAAQRRRLEARVQGQQRAGVLRVPPDRRSCHDPSGGDRIRRLCPSRPHSMREGSHHGAPRSAKSDEGRDVRDATPSTLPSRSGSRTTASRSTAPSGTPVEFAIRGGVPYAIDFLNPAPDPTSTPSALRTSGGSSTLSLRPPSASQEGGGPRGDRWSEFLSGGMKRPAAKKTSGRTPAKGHVVRNERQLLVSRLASKKNIRESTR